MTLVLLEKGLVLEGSNPKIEDKQVPGIYIYIHTIFSYICCSVATFPGGEKFPVIALDYQHRRSASALFL